MADVMIGRHVFLSLCNAAVCACTNINSATSLVLLTNYSKNDCM